MEEKNAVIEKASLSIEEIGLLSSYIYLDYGGSGQGFGGYALYLPKDYTHHTKESLAGHWIYRVLEIAGVENWEDLPGKTVRVRATYDKVHAIGHIIKDDWFTPSEDFKSED